ncbi:hypothetical protein NPIL_648521 [Nephila pilipes]|uniref:Uncharacterized protein n=1 Tax=Nephila pilipes TaxID=299642 RepID=A0A8X6T5D5_NEPPI|nr:hypothetical protein NPIL_648521 [Nephila pilipes]
MNKKYLKFLISMVALIRPDGKVFDHHWQESSTAGIRHRSLEDAPGYVPPEDFIDPDDSTTGRSHISPTFDESTPRSVTTQLGQTAYLHCIVNNLGDKTVKFYNILTQLQLFVLNISLAN